MALSNLACKQAAPRDKSYKLSDGDGMYLLVTPVGGKYWRVDYRFDGKRKTAALGCYPDVTLQRAREKRLELRQQLDSGLDPVSAKKQAKLLRALDRDASFESVAREWHENRAALWTPHYAKQVLSVLERDFFPDLGAYGIKEITPPILLETLRKIEDRGALDALADARGYAGAIFRYGIATGRADRDSAADLRDAFRRHTPEHLVSLRDDQLPAFLKTLYSKPGGRRGYLALKLILLTLVRTTELRAAEWAEFDWEAAQWVIPARRMKMRREHVVPLSRQAVALLKELKKETGKGTYLFPNDRKGTNPFMSENAMLKAVADLGYKTKTTVHGLRATGSTILHESGKFRSLVIERQLAHVDKNKVRASYNRAQYMAERKDMMQWWADYLDEAAAKKG